MERKACKQVDTVYESCHQALQQNNHAKNGVYRIKAKTPTNFTNVYCRMTSLPGCAGGGWTMVMKINGNKETFSYLSPYWSNRKSYLRANGKTGLDDNETKLATFWSTPFTQLCVGMKVDNLVRFIPIRYKANSLYDVLADGKFRPTIIPRSTWKSLYNNSSLQYNCGRQGFNVAAEDKHHARVRIGIIGNNGISCRTADSFIGFGAIDASQRRYCYQANIINTCGNSAYSYCISDNGDKEVRAMGYIFVR